MNAVRLNDEVREMLEAICQKRRFQSGEEITVKGEQHHAMYFILSGWVDIRFLDERNEACSLRVGERSVLGEMGFLSGRDAVATSVAVGPVTALELNQDVFDRLMEENPAAARELSDYLAQTIDKRLQ